MKRMILFLLLGPMLTNTMAAGVPEQLICQGLDQLTAREVVELGEGKIAREQLDASIELFKEFNCTEVLAQSEVIARQLRETCYQLIKDRQEIQSEISRAAMGESKLQRDKWQLLDERYAADKKIEKLGCK